MKPILLILLGRQAPKPLQAVFANCLVVDKVQWRGLEFWTDPQEDVVGIRGRQWLQAPSSPKLFDAENRDRRAVNDYNSIYPTLMCPTLQRHTRDKRFAKQSILLC